MFAAVNLADGNRLAVQKFSVAGNVFNGVADGVAEIQNRAQSALGFVLADDFRLDFATARDDRGERFGDRAAATSAESRSSCANNLAS